MELKQKSHFLGTKMKAWVSLMVRRGFVLSGIGWLGLGSLGELGAQSDGTPPKVTSIYSIDGEEVVDDESVRAVIRSDIKLELKGNIDSKQKLVPFINGVPLPGNQVFLERKVTGESDGDSEGSSAEAEAEAEADGMGDTYTARFRLRVTDESKANWLEILGLRTSKASLSIGPRDDLPYATAVDADKFEIRALSDVRRRVLIVTAIFILVLFLSLALKTAILRAFEEGVPFQEMSWSLARVQWGGWICIIAISFLLVWLVTGSIAVNSTALLLLGISTGTIVGAQMVGDKPLTNDGKDAAKKVLGGKNWKANKFSEKIRNGGKKLLADLVSDPNGKASLNRFQMLIFTLLLWGMYVASVVSTWTLPEYDNTIFGLMGISSGTYVGFKFKEASKADDAGQPVIPPEPEAAPGTE